MKKFLILLIMVMGASCANSCSKDSQESNNNDDDDTAAGRADITLTAGGKEFKLAGSCGWASAGGNNYIGANQDGNNLRTFSSYFNIKNLPSQTTTYTVVADSSTDTDPTHITMYISEIVTGTKPASTEWVSTNTSGKLKLVVEGKKITADLSGIVLSPSTPPSGFASGNTGAFANNGTLSGTLTFYKE